MTSTLYISQNGRLNILSNSKIHLVFPPTWNIFPDLKNPKYPSTSSSQTSSYLKPFPIILVGNSLSHYYISRLFHHHDIHLCYSYLNTYFIFLKGASSLNKVTCLIQPYLPRNVLILHMNMILPIKELPV